MRGICGIYNFKKDEKINREVLSEMLKAISHRGADGNDGLIFKKAALGYNFLNIDKAQEHVLKNENGSIALVLNGRIYNGKELRAELEAKGYIFRSQSDEELMLHLYEDRGPDFVKDLNGQFAIALYDENREELLLIRDHVGIAPLYYSVIDGRVVFGSEIKAILPFPGAPRKLNLKAVDQLMNFPGVVAPVTFFEDIYALRSGHMLSFRNGEVKDICYWDLLYPQQENQDLGRDYYEENLRELLKKAIERRFNCDTPAGFYISGGLDSSLVACFVDKFCEGDKYSFSAKIGSGDLDESRFQQIVKDSISSENFEIKVAEEEILQNLNTVVYHAETGLKESYDTAAYLLSGLVLESPVRAVLTGQGSDEFFCGYVGYMLDQFRNMQRNQISRAEQEINRRLWGDPFFRYERNHPEIRETHGKVYSKEIMERLPDFSALNESPIDVKMVEGLSDQKRRSYIDYKLRLQDHLLTEHGDRMFAAHGIEGRHPFLDMDVLNFVAKMPDKYKLNGTNEKYVVKRAGRGIVPREILKRKKFPFQAPGMSSLVKNADSLPFLSEELIRKYGIFDADYVNELKKIYSQEDFVLKGAYQIDYLLIVMTVTMLCEHYNLTV